MPKNTHDLLREIVAKVKCKPGWKFVLIDDEEGLRLRITDWKCVNAYQPDESFPLSHFFPVPTATYNEASWRRWIFDCCRGVENHELGEWFVIDGQRPFAPLHGPGENPYVVHEYRLATDALITQDGSMRSMASELEKGKD
jgi:hypothetical protein